MDLVMHFVFMSLWFVPYLQIQYDKATVTFYTISNDNITLTTTQYVHYFIIYDLSYNMNVCTNITNIIILKFKST